jgi:hypothetical protein
MANYNIGSDNPAKGGAKRDGGGDALPAEYNDKVRKTIDHQGQVAPEDYPDRENAKPDPKIP